MTPPTHTSWVLGGGGGGGLHVRVDAVQVV